MSENKITIKTKAPKQDKQDSDTHIKHGQSYKYWGQSLFFFWFCLLLLFLLAQSLSLFMMSLAADIPKMATPGTQYWVWAQRPFPPAVQTFCLGGTSNQMKDGLKKGRGQQANSDFFSDSGWTDSCTKATNCAARVKCRNNNIELEISIIGTQEWWWYSCLVLICT